MTEQVKFTPGPWYRSGCRSKVAGDDTHPVYATVDGKDIVIASVWYDPRTHEGFHDANLIAAAPELYEALLRVWDDIDDETMPATVAIIRAALAKAEGK